MNGKMHSETGAFSSDGMRAEILNPFVHKLELDNTYDKIKTAIFTVILLPFRVIVILYLIVTAWFLACIGLYGLSEEDLRKKPMTGWRRSLKPLICFIGKMSYLAGGMAISIRGRQASRREAPILVVAPHSSFLDSCIVYATRMSSVIVRKESMDNYVGKLINYTQPVYVWRDDPNSRQNTIKEIIERATSKEDWPQVLIFPEGTCTNRSCLITFKPGGFYPGVPVQPVTIRYPNARDTVTWTWEGPGALKLLWLTLTQVHSSCEIEFLPVYYPNEAEKKDPKLYARNVRDVMARALGVPVLDYTYDDCRLIARAKQLHIPGGAAAREVAEARQQLGLDRSGLDAGWCGAGARWVTREQFGERLGVPDHPALHKLFDIFVQRSSGLVYFPDYLLCTCFLVTQHAPLTELISYAFKLYDSSGSGRVQMTDFEEIATKCVGLSVEDAHNVFQQADAEEKGYLTYDEFISFAQKRSDFAFIFVSDTSHKPKSQ
ncbi:PREDICTED: 1-acylglycerophosphocholine O-acyltransferase 1 isoform X2 [Papilio xuthus]|uniref:1-acylglycerophosphocholine O-acyltransferase 1 isoform X2 n=1 Tax=Papilio xuthus TaxID=66420 RepID=A0AAJ7ED84_PAPXU|nr:PREDICTED: 1-acylglycerophosphocholine O-acyltransferase 1 isoform X2 [Papilio xuthus]